VADETLEQSAAAPASNDPSAAPVRYEQGKLPFGGKAARVALILLLLVGAAVALLPGGRAVYRAGMLLPSVITSAQPAPLAVNGGDVRHSQVTISSESGPVYLDVYEPVDAAPPIPGAREGILVIAGVGDNRKEPALVNISTALARAGFVVMQATTPALIDYTLTPRDTDAITQATLALERWPGVGADRIGILGISAGDALACLAAADLRLHGKLAFLTLFGGYYDATNLLRDVGRRALEVDGKLVSWNPQDVPINVLANSVADTLPPNDASRIRSALGVFGSALGENGRPLDAETLAQMSPGAVAAYHLLYGDQPDQAEANLAALPPASHDLLRALSPSSVVDALQARIYLMHDTSDQYVPFTESRDFDAALTRLGRSHEFVELNGFQHVEVRSGATVGELVGDGAHLFAILYQLLLIAS
jgi:dienelactone hydrolase